MSNFKKAIIALFILLLGIPLALFGYTWIKLNSIHVDSKYDSTIEKVDGITNILLTGIDARPGEQASRTDAMMILTIDKNNNNIKLTSLARDTYVEIPGRDKGKLNTAYFWGKEELLFKTIENEFGIGIDKFVQVDFSSLMDIIDILGGVEVEIPHNLVTQINNFALACYNNYNNPNKGEFKAITTSGKQLLNGYQALGFASIRKEDSAIKRDERQQEILVSLSDKLKNLSASELPGLMNTLLPYVKTNLNVSEILNISTTALGVLSKNSEVKQAEFPLVDYPEFTKGGIYKNAGWVWLYDLNSVVVLQVFIYKDVNMEDNIYLNDTSKVTLNY